MTKPYRATTGRGRGRGRGSCPPPRCRWWQAGSTPINVSDFYLHDHDHVLVHVHVVWPASLHVANNILALIIIINIIHSPTRPIRPWDEQRQQPRSDHACKVLLAAVATRRRNPVNPSPAPIRSGPCIDLWALLRIQASPAAVSSLQHPRHLCFCLTLHGAPSPKATLPLAQPSGVNHHHLIRPLPLLFSPPRTSLLSMMAPMGGGNTTQSPPGIRRTDAKSRRAES